MRMCLRYIRKKKGFTQNEAAMHMKITRQAYNLIEKGERQSDLNLSTMIAISDLFGLSLEEIRYLEECKN